MPEPSPPAAHRRRPSRALLVLALALLAAPPTGPAESAAQAGALADSAAPVVRGAAARRIDAFLSDLEARGFAGAALAALDGEVVLARGYGFADPARGVPNTPLTVFPTASLTKQFTAAAVVALAEDGLLALDDPLERWFEDAPADKAGITLHQLLTHTSGLPGSLGGDHDPVTRDAMIAEALAQPLAFEPGGGYLYSDPGYTLLAAIVELASGTSNDAYLKARLFAPAGMTRSGYVVDVPGEDLAHGVDPLGGDDLGTRFDRAWLDDGPWWYLRGAGGVHATILDMFRWDRALAAGTVLSAASTAALFGRHAEIAPGVYYGYGWGVTETERGTALHSHLGGSPYGTSYVARFPDEDAFLYLVSNSPVRVERFASDVARALFDPAAPLTHPDGGDRDALPDTPAGRAAADFVALVADPDPDAVRTFWRERLDAGFQRDDPPEAWIALFADLARELPDPVATEVDDLGPFQIVFTLRPGSGGAQRRVLLMLDRTPPHPIVGLDLR